MPTRISVSVHPEPDDIETADLGHAHPDGPLVRIAIGRVSLLVTTEAVLDALQAALDAARKALSA